MAHILLGHIIWPKLPKDSISSGVGSFSRNFLTLQYGGSLSYVEFLRYDYVIIQR